MSPSRGRRRRQPGARNPIWRRALIIFVGALLLRLAIAAGYPPPDTPDIAFYRGDAFTYHNYATALSRGEAYDQGLPIHPPLLAFAALPIYRLFSGTEHLFTILTLATAVLGSALAVLVLILGTRLGGQAVGLVAGVAVALHFGLATASTTFNVESLSAALELAAVFVLVREFVGQPSAGSALSRHRARRLLACGALAGFAALARAENQLLVLLLAAWAVWQPGARRRIDLRSGLLVLAGALIIILPWTLRNAIAIDHFNRTRGDFLAEPLRRFAPVTAYGGLNFALANHPDAPGGFSPDPLAGGGKLDFSRPEHFEYWNHGFALGLRWIAEDPAGTVRRVGRKLAIGLGALRLGYGAYDRPAGLKGVRPAVDFFRPERTLLLLPHLLLMGAGAILLVRRLGGRVALLVHLPLLTHLVALILFFGYVRLGLVAMPILLIDGAVAGVAGWEALTREIARRRGTPVSDRPRSGSGRGTLVAALIIAVAVLEGSILAARGQPMQHHGPRVVGSDRINMDGDIRIGPGYLDPPYALP